MLLRRVLDAPLDSAGADRLWSLSQGNLLYLRHLVDGELRSGRLLKVAGVWLWPEAPALSARLAEIVRSQMGQLPEEVLDVIDLLAVGEPVPLNAISALTAPAALEQEELRGLVRTDTVLGSPCAWPIRCTARCGGPRSGRLVPAGCGVWWRPHCPRRSHPPRRCGAQCSPWTPTCGPIPDAYSLPHTRRWGCST